MTSVKKSTVRPRSYGPRLLALGVVLTLAGAVADLRGEHRGAELAGSEACRHGKLEAFAARASGRDLSFDEATGADGRHFPPDRVVDFLHMRLQMRFEDLSRPRFTATELLRFVPIGRPTATLDLHAVGLRIEAVHLASRPVEFFHDGQTLSLVFAPPLAVDREHELIVDYVCERPWDGMFFTPPSPEAPQYTAEVHTQGQAESNRHWFVSHDFPNERMTTELIVNVPAGYSVSSNGRMLSTLESGDRANWHWLQDEPHVSYLVSLVIGKFDIVPIPHPRVPMAVWVPLGLGDRVMPTYGRTGEMLDLFERRFGVPYPWDRYDQLVVKNFNAGGMENTSATTMYPSAVLDERALLDGDLDGLIAHELAHQWTGDLITCRSWEHIWLNEGWATFGDALWVEHRDGEDGYLDEMRGNFRVARRDRTTNDLPMVSPVYENADSTFGRPANPYSKGAAVLHMLRTMLGEEVFWKGVHLYMSRHAMGLVETSDLRYAMEEVSGLGLEWFFEQWCYRPGCPDVAVDVRYRPASRELHLKVEQRQQIDARTPAMRFTLPVHVRTASGWTVVEVDVAERTAETVATLPGVPGVVAVDPYLHVLKTIEVTKPDAMWRAQIAHGPTIAARHEAIAALGELDAPEHVALLAAIVRDESERHTIRQSAVRSLRRFGSDEAKGALADLVATDVADARVRADLTEAARDIDRDRAIEVLVRRASSDESYATRGAAIDALARLEAKDHADLIAELAHMLSQHEQVRLAALRALARLDDPRGLDLAMQYATYGHLDRARATAIGVVGDLAGHDPDRAVPFLLELLDDPEQRTRRAAVRALGETKDERAREPLQAIAQTHADPALRELAERTLKEMKETEE